MSSQIERSRDDDVGPTADPIRLVAGTKGDGHERT
jgi:hypothetical protein